MSSASCFTWSYRSTNIAIDGSRGNQSLADKNSRVLPPSSLTSGSQWELGWKNGIHVRASKRNGAKLRESSIVIGLRKTLRAWSPHCSRISDIKTSQLRETQQLASVPINDKCRMSRLRPRGSNRPSTEAEHLRYPLRRSSTRCSATHSLTWMDSRCCVTCRLLLAFVRKEHSQLLGLHEARYHSVPFFYSDIIANKFGVVSASIQTLIIHLSARLLPIGRKPAAIPLIYVLYAFTIRIIHNVTFK